MASNDVVERVVYDDDGNPIQVPVASTTAPGIAEFNPEDFAVTDEGVVYALQKVGSVQYVGVPTPTSTNTCQWTLQEGSAAPLDEVRKGQLIMATETVENDYGTVTVGDIFVIQDVVGDVVTTFMTALTSLRGPQGEKGDKGDKGDTGEKGDTGPANTLTIGTVEKGEEASATITGEAPNQVLNLVLPKGDKGDTGEKGDTGDKGDKGDTGEKGDTGPANTLTIGNVTTLETGQDATASITGTAPNQYLHLGLPRGPRGYQGEKGEKGDSGNSFQITGEVDSSADLPTASSSYLGEAYYVGATAPREVWACVYDADDGTIKWSNQGTLEGAQGEDGKSALIRTAFNTNEAPVEGVSYTMSNQGEFSRTVEVDDRFVTVWYNEDTDIAYFVVGRIDSINTSAQTVNVEILSATSTNMYTAESAKKVVNSLTIKNGDVSVEYDGSEEQVIEILATQPISGQIIITTRGWSAEESIAEVTIEGVTSSSTVEVAASEGYAQLVVQNNIRIYEVDEDTIKFICDSTPTDEVRFDFLVINAAVGEYTAKIAELTADDIITNRLDGAELPGSNTNLSAEGPVSYTYVAADGYVISSVSIDTSSVTFTQTQLTVSGATITFSANIASNRGNYGSAYGEVFVTITLTDDTAINDTFVLNCYWTCLTGDMLITMADGTQKRVDSLSVGEKVLSFNPETMELEPDTIVYSDSTENKTRDNYDIWTWSNGTIIKTVKRHRFYNIERQAMINMDEWRIGEHTYSIKGEIVELISHENVKETVNHYTLFTEHQNYFVNGLLSGNKYTAPMEIK